MIKTPIVGPFSTNIFLQFHHLQKVGCNSADFGYKSQIQHKMKTIVHGYLLDKLNFEIIFEEV